MTIKIMKAEELPLITRRKFDIFSGLVEITIKNKDDMTMKKINKFSDAFEKVIKEEGFVNLKI